ncbi:MAG: hypothetical protein ACYC56_00770 [Candidatus Aquicultor sp.]
MKLKSEISVDKIKEMVKTPKGKGAAAGLLLVVALLVVLVVSTLAFPTPGGGPATNVAVQKSVIKPAVRVSSTQTASSVEGTASVSTSTASSTSTVSSTDTVEIEPDITGYRDPFTPLSEPTTTVSVTSSAGSFGGVQVGQSGDTTPTSNSLALKAIANVNGIKFAVVIYKAQEYAVEEGDQIAGSPFKVTDIGDGSISLLYGDDRLTLQVGDEIIK